MSVLSGPFNDLLGHTGEFVEIDQWRERIFATLLRLLLPLVLVAAVPYTYFAFLNGVSLPTLVHLVAIIAILMAGLTRILSYNVRALCLVVIPFIGGTSAVFLTGTMGLMYLIVFPIAAVILLGARFGVAAVVSSLIMLLLASQFSPWSPQLAGIKATPMGIWLVIAVNYTIAATIVTSVCGILIQKLESSLVTQKIAAHSIELRQQELTRVKAELANVLAGKSAMKPTGLVA
jgi:hypothetical protein